VSGAYLFAAPSHQFPLGEMTVTRRLQLSLAVAEEVDAWLAPDYRYFKLMGEDGDTYLVRYDERSNIWELTMFRAERVGE
jgi:hypothetical protein